MFVVLRESIPGPRRALLARTAVLMLAGLTVHSVNLKASQDPRVEFGEVKRGVSSVVFVDKVENECQLIGVWRDEVLSLTSI